MMHATAAVTEPNPKGDDDDPEQAQALPASKPKTIRHLPRSPFMRGILNFTPSWFSVNMGTGIISVLLHTSPHKFRGEDVIGTVLYFLNIFLFALFSAATIARYCFFPWVFQRMLRNPHQILFLGTIPVGLATIVNATVLIAVPKYGDWAADLSWALWWIDVGLTLTVACGVPLVLFQVHDVKLEKMTAAWLLPVVPAVVCGASGGIVASVLEPERAQITLLVSYVLWGFGMLLAVLVMALYFHRLAIHKLPNAEVIVSALLPLGATGQGAFGILQIARVAQKVFKGPQLAGVAGAGDIVLVVSTITALVIWGWALWWLAHGVFCVVIRMATSKLEFNMGWWGFVFPLGVFTSATAILGEVLPSAFMSYLSVVLLVPLVLLYVMVGALTFMGFYNRKLLKAPCIVDIKELEAEYTASLLPK